MAKESPNALKILWSKYAVEILFLLYTNILRVKAGLVHDAQAELILTYDI